MAVPSCRKSIDLLHCCVGGQYQLVLANYLNVHHAHHLDCARCVVCACQHCATGLLLAVVWGIQASGCIQLMLTCCCVQVIKNIKAGSSGEAVVPQSG